VRSSEHLRLCSRRCRGGTSAVGRRRSRDPLLGWVQQPLPDRHEHHSGTRWTSQKRTRETFTALAHTAEDQHDPDQAAAVAVPTAVSALPQRLRPVVPLHYYADLTVEDVASATRRPVGSVKRQLPEARALLAHQLQETSGA
jgi:DNA-directed RNA polymerase specialized sigma24 family protein